MIIWGSGGDSVDFGVAETHHCETCEKERPYRLVLHYRYWGFYWVFNRVTKKQYAMICDICGRGWEIESSKIEPLLDTAPIPFMRRYGLAILGGIFAIFMVMAALEKH